MSSICEIILGPTKPHIGSVSLQKRIGEFEQSLNCVEPYGLGYCDGQSKATVIVRLYRLAALIFLNRALIDPTKKPSHHRRLVDDALLCLADVWMWEAPWPFFIIACEAETESQRRDVLQFISEMPVERHSSNSDWVQWMIAAALNQDDLHVDRRLDYVTKISAVVSSCPFVPPFA
jgi:hypothetical protein